jgi:4-amino-4-deoxy-L-arabinose transferase-like glycosyltransferase
VSPRALTALLFALLAIGLSYRLGAPPPHHRSEKRSDAIVREILRTDEWLFPSLGGTARLQKPPLYYWTAAAVAELAGGPSAATLRSVSAFAGFALAALVLAWGANSLDEANGLAAAGALAAMGQFWISARLGTADMLLVLFSTAALFAFERLAAGGERRRLPLLSLLVVLAFLCKATAALVDVFVPIGVWLAAERRLALALRPVVLFWAALAASAGLAWYVAALWLVPEAPARLHEFFFVPLGAGHSDLASDHYHPVYWYVPRFFGAAFPAVLLLPLVIRDGVRTRFWREVPVLRFAATSALALFVAWSLIPQKGRHYLLPILPFFALLVGNALVRAVRRE